ncbi:hypothetical protein I4U23_025713 [Adineta vaga]|nr:hypothetical protein I4U23_025713 [Adineta vaga]
MIADAETKIAQLYSMLTFNHQQPFLSTIVESSIESDEQITTQNNENEVNIADNIRQCPENISSPATHETIPLSPPVLSSDHLNISTAGSSTISQTTNTINKRKQRRKKKDKKDIVQHTDHVQSQPNDVEESTLSQINQTSDHEIDQLNTNSTVIFIESKKDKQIQERLKPSNRAWYSSQYKIASTESERLLFTQAVSSSENTPEIELENKTVDQKLQVIYDDYPWYSSYYIIVDAETKMAQLHNLLNCSRKQSILATPVEHQKQILEQINPQNLKTGTKDEDDFQCSKRIPSPLPTLISSTKLSLSPNIDPKPVVLHERANTSIPISQPVGIVAKKKHKKKRNNKEDIVSFDAPELTTSNDNKQDFHILQSATVVKLEHPKINEPSIINATQELSNEQQQSNISNDNDTQAKMISSVDLHFRYSLLLDRLHTLIQPVVDLSSVMARVVQEDSSLSNTIAVNEETPKPTVRQIETCNDNKSSKLEEIQQHFLETPSTLISPSTSTKSTLSSDIDLEPIPLHDHLAVSTTTSSTLPETVSTASKKRHRRRKKTKKQLIEFDTPEATAIDVDIQAQTLPVINQVLESEVKNVFSTAESKKKSVKKKKSIATTTATSTEPKLSPSPESTLPSPSSSQTSSIKKTATIRLALQLNEEEKEEDNEGFQLVTNRKRVRSGPGCEKIQPLSIVTSKPISTSHMDMLNIPIVNKQKNLLTTSNIPNKNELVFSSKSTIKEQESKSQSSVTPSSTAKNSNVSLKQTNSEEDNDGFQVVRHRKRMKSAPVSEKARIFSLAKTPCNQSISHDTNPKSASIHGRPTSASRSTPCTNSTIVTPFRSNQQETKQSQSILKTFQLSPTKRTGQVNIIKQSPTVNTTTTDVERTTVAENDNNGSEVVQKQKPKSSHTTLTIFNKSNLISINDKKSTDDTYTTFDSLPSEIISISETSQNDILEKSMKTKTEAEVKPSLSSRNNADSTPLSVEETSSENKLPLTSDETSFTTTDYEIITTQNIESLHEIENTETILSTDKSSTSLVIVLQESTASADDIPKEDNDIHVAESIKPNNPSESLNQISTKLDEPITEILTPSTHIEDEQTKTIANKRRIRSRKKKICTRTKPDDDDTSTSSTNISITKHVTHINIDSDLQKSHTSFCMVSTNLSSQNIDSQLIPSKDKSNTDDKLDLFLPEYIRQKLNTNEICPSSSTHSHDEPDVTSTATTTSSSEYIPVKKSRPKMLAKDHEAKSLLTNEFDYPSTPEIQPDHQEISSDDENIHDEDDEFVIQVINSDKSDKDSKQNADNILSRGFCLWLQEGRALSQPTDKASSSSSSSSSKHLLNAIQRIVIQPTETDEDEDSWNSPEIVRSTFITGVQPEKKIHITNAYLINHPRSDLTTSWHEIQPTDDKFPDDLDKYDPDDNNERDSYKGIVKQRATHHNNTQVSITENRQHHSNHHEQTTSIVEDMNESSVEDFCHQPTKDTDHTIHFDDWAHFFEQEFEIEFSAPLECFYTRPFDKDTLICEVIPIHHSIRDHQSRYGDFSSSDNDAFLTEPSMHYSFQKSKPSDYFQRCQNQESLSMSYDNDEILISHLPNGLSRRMNL